MLARRRKYIMIMERLLCLPVGGRGGRWGKAEMDGDGRRGILHPTYCPCVHRAEKASTTITQHVLLSAFRKRHCRGMTL